MDGGEQCNVGVPPWEFAAWKGSLRWSSGEDQDVSYEIFLGGRLLASDVDGGEYDLDMQKIPQGLVDDTVTGVGWFVRANNGFQYTSSRSCSLYKYPLPVAQVQDTRVPCPNSDIRVEWNYQDPTFNGTEYKPSAYAITVARESSNGTADFGTPAYKTTVSESFAIIPPNVLDDTFDYLVQVVALFDTPHDDAYYPSPPSTPGAIRIYSKCPSINHIPIDKNNVLPQRDARFGGFPGASFSRIAWSGCNVGVYALAWFNIRSDGGEDVVANLRLATLDVNSKLILPPKTVRNIDIRLRTRLAREAFEKQFHVFMSPLVWNGTHFGLAYAIPGAVSEFIVFDENLVIQNTTNSQGISRPFSFSRNGTEPDLIWTGSNWALSWQQEHSTSTVPYLTILGAEKEEQGSRFRHAVSPTQLATISGESSTGADGGSISGTSIGSPSILYGGDDTYFTAYAGANHKSISLKSWETRTNGQLRPQATADNFAEDNADRYVGFPQLFFFKEPNDSAEQRKIGVLWWEEALDRSAVSHDIARMYNSEIYLATFNAQNLERITPPTIVTGHGGGPPLPGHSFGDRKILGTSVPAIVTESDGSVSIFFRIGMTPVWVRDQRRSIPQAVSIRNGYYYHATLHDDASMTDIRLVHADVPPAGKQDSMRYGSVRRFRPNQAVRGILRICDGHHTLGGTRGSLRSRGRISPVEKVNLCHERP